MGMAASQARYLALSARKTNVEYEGQQINQSRLLLSNQSADLFNQMLGMEVPTAPSTQDFTVIQYSYSDGNNTSTFSSYQQLGTKDSDYNYVVTSYHYENIYTGSKKLLNDPQIQATAENNYTYSADENKETKSIASVTRTGSGTTADPYAYQVVTKDGATKTFRLATTTEDEQVRAISLGQDTPQTSAWKVKEWQYTDVTAAQVTAANFEQVTAPTDDEKKKIADLYGIDDLTTIQNNYYKAKTGGAFDGKDLYITKAEFDAAAATQAREITEMDGKGVDELTGTSTMYTDGTTFVTQGQLEACYGSTATTIDYMTTTNTPKFSDYKAVGNCDLSAITSDDYAKESIKAEIDQIRKDMKAATGSTTAAERLEACFDSTTGEYLGGIYTFKMGGVTYYTTKDDLDESLASGYSSSATSDNAIDNQSKLSYYNASYLQTKIEETKKALLETDGNGRFSTVKFEDDSVVYTLNVESVTDEAAYNDAINQYNYKQQEYDKAINDINAKTEVLQAQDRELELRLEQLNTEQSALQNEMEAVKKVVDKHVETGFKTFGG